MTNTFIRRNLSIDSLNVCLAETMYDIRGFQKRYGYQERISSELYNKKWIKADQIVTAILKKRPLER